MRSAWTRRRFLCALGSTALGLASPVRLRGGEEKNKQPNVLFIALDDLNNWIKVLDASAPIQTPNIERLAKRGTLFTKAYCASAACNPSRTSILTGLRPTTSGVYGNKLEIDVVNLWPNRLIGDAGLPKEKRLTRTNVQKFYRGKHEPVSSGLLGPVTLHMSGG